MSKSRPSMGEIKRAEEISRSKKREKLTIKIIEAIKDENYTELKAILDEISKNLPPKERQQKITPLNGTVDDESGASITPLYVAVQREDIEAVRILLNRSSIDANAGKFKFSHISSSSGGEDSSSYFENSISTSVSNETKIDREKISPLFLAVQKGNVEIVKLLLEHPSIDIFKGHNIKREWSRCSSNPDDTGDSSLSVTHQSPFQEALKQREVTMARELLERGAGIKVGSIDVQKAVEMGVDFSDVIVMGIRTQFFGRQVTTSMRGFEYAITSPIAFANYLIEEKPSKEELQPILKACNNCPEHSVYNGKAKDENASLIKLQIEQYQKGGVELLNTYIDAHPRFESRGCVLS